MHRRVNQNGIPKGNWKGFDALRQKTVLGGSKNGRRRRRKLRRESGFPNRTCLGEERNRKAGF